MARPNPIRTIMLAPLPGITYQRRKQFRPQTDDIDYAYKIINRHVFNNQLKKPNITVRSGKKVWGTCQWNLEQQPSGSWCDIQLNDKWFCAPWFMNVLAHEMVHQYQWDIGRWQHLDMYGRELNLLGGGHGPSFFEWRDQFEYYGLNLKTWFGNGRWFRYQDFTRC